jgi:hypothetical protein
VHDGGSQPASEHVATDTQAENVALAFRIARVAREEGAELVLTGFDRLHSATWEHQRARSRRGLNSLHSSGFRDFGYR